MRRVVAILTYRYLLIMEYTTLKVGRGFHYACDGKLYVRSCTTSTTQVKYLRCTVFGCMGRAKIDGDLLTITYQHTDHDESIEIATRQLKEKCRKRAAEAPTTTLRQIFDEEVRNSTNAASITFTEIESSMYKRRRLQQPELPG